MHLIVHRTGGGRMWRRKRLHPKNAECSLIRLKSLRKRKNTHTPILIHFTFPPYVDTDFMTMTIKEEFRKAEIA